MSSCTARFCALLATALLGLASPASQGADAPYRFGVFGDTPYNSFERQHLPELLSQMDQQPLAVVIHDGDIKSGGERCDDRLLDERLALFQTSLHPFVLSAGDNEWTDCHRASNGGYDPLERLEALRKRFYPQGHTLGQTRLSVRQPEGEFAAYREFMAWTMGPVEFIILNLPGSENNFGPGTAPGAEHLARSRVIRHWLAEGFARARDQNLQGIVVVIQANPEFEQFAKGQKVRGYQAFLEQLVSETEHFDGEVLLVHGDTHWHRIDRPLVNPRTGLQIGNLIRLETYGSPFMGWVEVEVRPGQRSLFKLTPHPFSPPAQP